AMFNEYQFSAGLQDPPHLLKGFLGLWNGAQRPRHYNRIDALVGKRQGLLRRLQQKFYVSRTVASSLSRQLLQFGRRVDPAQMPDLRRIKSQVQTRTNSNFKHVTPSTRNPLGAQPRRVLVSHRKINESRQNVFSVESHLGSAQQGSVCSCEILSIQKAFNHA